MMNTDKAAELVRELQVDIEHELNNNSTYIYYDWLPAIRGWLYLVDQLVALLENNDEN